LNKHDKVKETAPKSKEAPQKTGLFGKLGDLVKKAIDCCIE